MGVTVFVDHEDDVGTVLRVNALTDRDTGTLVAHVPLTAFSTRLPQDILRAVGHRPDAPDWPRTIGPAWSLARAWCRGFDVCRLILYGAWRLSAHELARLELVAHEDNIEIALVTLGALHQRGRHPFRSQVARPISELLEADPPRSRTPAGTDGVITGDLAPLPAADFAAFLTECAGVLSPEEWQLLVDAYSRAYHAAAEAVEAGDVSTAVIDYLAASFRRARTANDVLVLWRSTQAAALERGHLLHIDLERLGQIVALALNTAPENHGRWPTRGPIRPVDHAAAALAWATGADVERLCAVRTSDLDDECSMLGDGAPIPACLRAPIRAQRWLKLHQFGSDGPLLSRTSAIPTAAAMQRRLDEISPDALGAAGSDRRLQLNLGKHITVQALSRHSDVRRPTHRRPAPASTFKPWINDGIRSSAEVEMSMGIGEMSDSYGYNRAASLRAQMFVAGGAAIPGPTSFRSDAIDQDAKRLHGLLVAVGGEANRSDLLVGFGWDTRRLHNAVHAANDLLDGLGERIMDLPEGALELRGYVDRSVETAIRRISNRTCTRVGLSHNGAALLRELLEADDHTIALGELDEADDHASVNELVRAGLASREPEAIRMGPGVPIAFLRVVGDSWSRRMPSRRDEAFWT